MQLRMNQAPRISVGKIMKWVVIPIVLLIALMGCFSIISTGNVGVKKTMGQTSLEESTAGLVPKLPFVTSVDEYNVRETVIDFMDLKPKAGDNLSLQDLDVSVFYQVNPSKVADLHVEFLGQTRYDEEEGVYLPGYGVVMRQSREAIYDTVSTIDSLTIHQKRDELTNAIKIRLQRSLDQMSPGAFIVTQVALRAVVTDPSIEESIQLAVKAQKDLERTEVELEIGRASRDRRHPRTGRSRGQPRGVRINHARPAASAVQRGADGIRQDRCEYCRHGRRCERARQYQVNRGGRCG